mgnify:CR=1 FL=1
MICDTGGKCVKHFNNINIKDLREKKFDLLVVFVNHDWLKKNSINYKKKIIL